MNGDIWSSFVIRLPHRLGHVLPGGLTCCVVAVVSIYPTLGDGGVVVPLWGLSSRAFGMTIDVACSDEPAACHVSSLVVAPFVRRHHRCRSSASPSLWMWESLWVEASMCELP